MRVERTETKYMLTIDTYGHLIDKIPKLLEPDGYNGAFGYKVTSLYFDSIFNKDFYDKVDGVEDRKKIRLRFYNESYDKIKLELKTKRNTFQAKESMWISKEDAVKLQECDYSCLDNYSNSIAEKIRHIMCTRDYRPVVKIEYLRKAFIGEVNATRVTFDSELKASETCLDLFASSEELERLPDQYYAILEVKSTGELPQYIKKQLIGLSESSRAVSKYRESRWLFEELNII